mgnify:CR=1 FL=1
MANAYYENGLGKCSYPVPDGQHMEIELLLKRTYEIEDAKLIDYYDSEVVANDELLTRYLAKIKSGLGRSLRRSSRSRTKLSGNRPITA